MQPLGQKCQEEIDIPTRYYLGREQNVQRRRVIQKITKENGEVTDKEEEIKETFSNFATNFTTKEKQTERYKKDTARKPKKK